MCGYCVESMAISDIVKSEAFFETVGLDESLVPNYLKETDYGLNEDSLPYYLQETAYISKFISWGKQFDTVKSFCISIDRRLLQPNDFHRTIDIAFCRFWETLLYQGQYDIYQTIMQEYGEEIVKKFLSDLRNNEDSHAWIPLSCRNLYEDSICWEQFISNKQQLIEDAEATLEFYFNWWILGMDKVPGDPSTRDDKGQLIMVESIMNTPTHDWKRFYSLFPVVYFSFLILSISKKSSDIIKRIALKEPHDVPDFPGHDLWLQRKAFSFCVREYGVQFILEKYRTFRNELIYYSLLKGSVCKEDLDALKNYLLSNEPIEFWHTITTDDLVQVINKLQG